MIKQSNACGADQGGDCALCEGGANEEHDLVRLLHHPDARDRRGLCLILGRVHVNSSGCGSLCQYMLFRITCKCQKKLPCARIGKWANGEQALGTASCCPSSSPSSHASCFCTTGDLMPSLCADIEPDLKVRAAMNEINAAQRLRRADRHAMISPASKNHSLVLPAHLIGLTVCKLLTS